MTVSEDRAMVRAANERRREWRILPVDGVHVLQHYIDWARCWQELYRAATWDECDQAYDAYHNGETPADNEYWQ